MNVKGYARYFSFFSCTPVIRSWHETGCIGSSAIVFITYNLTRTPFSRLLRQAGATLTGQGSAKVNPLVRNLYRPPPARGHFANVATPTVGTPSSGQHSTQSTREATKLNHISERNSTSCILLIYLEKGWIEGSAIPIVVPSIVGTLPRCQPKLDHILERDSP